MFSTENWIGRFRSQFFFIAGVFAIFLAIPGRLESAGVSLTPIQAVCVDENAIGYGTFQSHNQKVLQNRNGVFMTHIRSRNDPYTAQCWRLLRSADNGETFSIVHEATDATNPPVIETDERSNLYLMRPDWEDGLTYLYRFPPAGEGLDPEIRSYSGGAVGKFCMKLDPGRQKTYYMAHDGMFFALTLNGQLKRSLKLITSGDDALLQYPHLELTAEGTLYLAWTSQKHGEYLYWDIHVMKSADGGEKWTTLAGSPLAIPVLADSGGEADRITLDNEFEIHTWLSNFIVKKGKIHFCYMAQSETPRMRYVRCDEKTGSVDINSGKSLRGESIELLGLDGFFATIRSDPDSPLYCISRFGNRIGCLMSEDDGKTWRDYAVSEPFTNPYSIGGNHAITPEGYILGIFTDQASTPEKPSRVYFFKIKA